MDFQLFISTILCLRQSDCTTKMCKRRESLDLLRGFLFCFKPVQVKIMLHRQAQKCENTGHAGMPVLLSTIRQIWDYSAARESSRFHRVKWITKTPFQFCSITPDLWLRSWIWRLLEDNIPYLRYSGQERNGLKNELVGWFCHDC